MAYSVHLAFRFHVNFYHSYRGDTPDEAGFGKDIRVIRHILDVLDRLNAEGVPIRATWDLENAFSLGEIMPAHCPDLIARLQQRVRDGRDEIELMSYNNGLISAHTATEFDAAIARAWSNAEGSGLCDLFNVVRPVVRPQEMLTTPLHLKLYRRHGIEAISLFYSAVPFNTFSTFIDPLPLEQSYNPLTLTHPGIEERLTLIPARNHGDIIDHLSLRRWVRQLRHRQAALASPTDLLLLIDADADDEFWVGFDWPLVKLLSAAQGLEGLVRSVADLEGLAFTTPYAYLETHPPQGTVTFGQDTADGSFDGLASWAEKASNHALWSGIERGRILELQARRLARDPTAPEIAGPLQEGFEARLRALSTTHFGLAAPVMNRQRLQTAAGLVGEAFHASSSAFDRATGLAIRTDGQTRTELPAFRLVDYARGIDTEAVTYPPHSSRGLIRVPLASVPDSQTTDTALLTTADGHRVPAAIRRSAQDQQPELWFVDALDANSIRDYTLAPATDRGVRPEDPVRLTDGGRGLSNGALSLTLDARGHPAQLALQGQTRVGQPFLRSAVRYGRRIREIAAWRLVEARVVGDGVAGVLVTEGHVPVTGTGRHRPPDDRSLVVRRELVLAAGLPYLYLTTHVRYPRTPPNRRRSDLARRLGRPFDTRWREVMPCEIRPGLRGRPLRVWKHNYLDHVSSYDLRKGPHTSLNNQITHGWLAVSDLLNGWLVAQGGDATSCFAFCPLRLAKAGPGTELRLNPFGTTWGRHPRYPTADTGLGKHLALLMADNLQSLAPSYNGYAETFTLMLAPYRGDAPPEALQHDAEAFAYPYALVSTSPMIGVPRHRTWTPHGLVD